MEWGRAWRRLKAAALALMPLALTLGGPATAQLGANDPGTAPVIDRDRADRQEPRIAPAAPPAAA
ncbi:MAG TPA: ShlB/FhaC/HecB family hemolysin secretion/activation protein, partial [Sphingobium sp.]|nr:ShlB/FhaC/HecB family hemolysin secretion/activation protein [Sphingobium sp.]